MSARDLTGAGLIRTLRNLAAGPAVTRAVARRADELAAAIAARSPGARVTTTPRGANEIVVTASAEGLFVREFGGTATMPDPVIGPAIDEIAGRAP
jgi:hypothetical protein